MQLEIDYRTLCCELQRLSSDGLMNSHTQVIPLFSFPSLQSLNLKEILTNHLQEMKAGLVCVCMRWCVFLASHRRAQPLLPMQTQCGPSASATCPGETLPRESCHIHQGEGRSVDMYLAAFGTYCIWIMHVIIFYGIRFHYKYYLTVENSICSLNGIKLLKH